MNTNNGTGLVSGWVVTPGTSRQPLSILEQRAALVVKCACELLGTAPAAGTDITLPLSVVEFEQEFRNRYAATHPELVFRTESTLERARLERTRLPHLPRVILRQGAPRRVPRR